MDLTRSLADVYSHGGVVGSSRNLNCYISTAGTSATWTASELILSTGLGSVPVRVGNVSLTINISTTGANGMDTGTAPVSGYVGIYAIYNPSTNTLASVAVNATSATVPEVYGGANMPVGYTASTLIGIWPTNASSQFKPGLGRDRRFYYQTAVAIFTGAASVGTLTLQSIAAGVPLNGTLARLFFGSLNSSRTPVLSISGDNVGTSSFFNVLGLTATLTSLAAGIPSQNSGIVTEISMVTPQTIYWMETNSGSNNSIYALGYGF